MATIVRATTPLKLFSFFFLVFFFVFFVFFVSCFSFFFVSLSFFPSLFPRFDVSFFSFFFYFSFARRLLSFPRSALSDFSARHPRNDSFDLFDVTGQCLLRTREQVFFFLFFFFLQ